MQALRNDNKDFPFGEVKKLYIKNKHYFENPDYPFESFIKDFSPHVWAFVENKELVGYIFLHSFTENSCSLSGNANRKLSNFVNEAICGTCGYYFKTFNQLQKIYSTTDFRHAKIALLRAGFKHIENDKFLLERN